MMSFPPQVIALAELTQMLGVTKNRAMQISRKADFPVPLGDLSVGRIWSYEAVAEFCEATGRKVHAIRPRSPSNLAVPDEPNLK
jgi:hypothetical protein